jgi:hypothetical protein
MGLTKAQVRASRDGLLAQGRYPSVDAVRAALGNTGSKSTIHRYLKELGEETTPAASRREDTALSLHAMVEQLADRLHDEAEQRLQEKDRELAELRATVARLTARLEALEDERADAAFARRERTTPGFGVFCDRLSNSRGENRDSSPFSMMSASARSGVFDLDSMRPPALKFL